jgi:Raf kinase inhibitor-like YbhB/YbcL family protein
MRKSLVGGIGLAVLFVAASAGIAQQGGAPPAPPLSLKTAAFTDGGDIPLKYGCDVAQGAPMISQELDWTNTPKGAVSFVLIMHDTDANPQKGILDVTHWTVFNIAGGATSIPEGVAPDSAVGDGGMQGKNIRGANGYQAPCPPKGGPPHHYVFELYALDSKLDLPAGAPRVDLLKAMDGHIIGKSSYIGKFHH